MRRIIAIILGAVTAVAAAALPAASQTTARGMFDKLQAREQRARKAIDAGKPSAVVRRDVERIVVGYEGLVRRFPRSGYSDNALWQAAMLCAESFARYRVDVDRERSVRLLRRLGSQYPSSSLIARARPALQRLAGGGSSTVSAEAGLPARPEGTSPPLEPVSTPRNAGPVESAAPARGADASRTPLLAASSRVGGGARLQAIRRTVLPDVVRIAVELDREVDYKHERIEGPVRVFLDLATTEVGPNVSATTTFDDDAVRAIRLGQRPAGTLRVVLDLDAAGRHSVFTLYNPYRIIVDVDRRDAPRTTLPTPVDGRATDRVIRAVDTHPRLEPIVAATARPEPAAPERVVVPADEDVKLTLPVEDDAESAVPVTPLAARRAAPGAAPTTAPAAPTTPSANAAGRFSLSRQLGLGVARIVIDPGHGGHDPGARSRGLSEAELVLDVAHRLEQLLKKDPGVEVVLTRRSDVFIPLEERTAMANRQGADLFLSIHANASRNSKAKGVETYFLNFASNPDAEAVAARENSASGRTMHSLPDIVKAIALNNKLDESRDFATLVQRAMVEHLARANREVRDLGVKQAPFVVLIGAGMPSVLAEISFVTHSQEGRLLKTAAYRQRIAEALLQGIRRYQRSLKAVTAVASQE